MRVKIIAIAAVAVAIGGMVGLTQTSTAEAKKAKPPKVTICHRTNAVNNPYVQLTVAQSAVDGVAGNSGSKPDHYGEHQGPLVTATAQAQALKDNKIKWGDIIPPVPGFHDGLNWTTEGQAVYNNGCNPVVTVDYCDPTQRPRGMSIKQWVPNDVRCVEPSVTQVCGEVTATITNQTPYNYDVSWSEGAPDYNFNTSLTSTPATFPEDYNGGSVEVYYWVVGAEADYVTDRNIPNYWEQNAASVTVDTDCEGEPGRGGGMPTEPTKPTTPTAEEVVSLPTTAGSGETAALISLSALSVMTIAGALIRRRFSSVSL